MSGSEDPVAWLRAQVEARRAAAEAATPGPWEFEGDDPADDELFTVYDGVVDLMGVTVAFTRDRQVANGQHMALNDPVDVIARCEAELAILDQHQPVSVAEGEFVVKRWQECQECGPNNDLSGVYAVPGEGESFWPCQTLRVLLGAYKHQPGFKAEWAS